MSKKIDKTDFRVEWSLLENGLDFLNSAIQNLILLDEENVSEMEETEKKRLLKYSVLHLISSMEIIFKQKLLMLDWKYLFENPTDDADEQKYRNGDFKSVNHEKAIKRLQKYCNVEIKNNEEKKIEKLKKIRNKIEHYKLDENYLTVLMVELNVVEILISFINNYILKEYRLSEEEEKLFASIKEKTHGLEDFIKERERKILEENPQGEFLPCPNCGKMYFEHNKKCLLCYYEPNDGTGCLSDDYVYNVLGIGYYTCIKQGGIYPVFECPECYNETLVYDNEVNKLCFCYECGFKDEIDNYDFCLECGKLMYKNDMDICEECIKYKMDKE